MSECKYIHGDPLGEWSYCGKPTKKRSSYCYEHHAICYVLETATEDDIIAASITAPEIDLDE